MRIPSDRPARECLKHNTAHLYGVLVAGLNYPSGDPLSIGRLRRWRADVTAIVGLNFQRDACKANMAMMGHYFQNEQDLRH